MAEMTIVKNTDINHIESGINYEITEACSLLHKDPNDINIPDTAKCLSILKKHFNKENSNIKINSYCKNKVGVETSWSPLIACIYVGFSEGVNYLLEQGADPNFCGKDGFSPLSIAAQKTKLAIPLKLIKKGAKVNFRDIRGKTALMQACEVGNLDLVKILLEAQADIKIKSNDQKDCLSFAMEKEKFNIVRYIENYYLNKTLASKDNVEIKKTKI